MSSWYNRTLWSYYFKGNVKVPEICIHSINLQCPDERKGCSRLHAKNMWHWQILKNNEWHNFLETQSDRLERSFLNVENYEVVIPSLDPTKTGKLGQELIKLLGTDSWKADFRQMKLMRINHSDFFHIRRLSTPSTEKFKSKYSSEFRWFLQEDGWVEFGLSVGTSTQHDSGTSQSGSSSTTSSEIEKQYQKDQSTFMTVNVLSNKCKLDFLKMELTYKKSRRVIPVQRRPRNDNMIYPSVWSYHIQGDVEVPEICTNTVADKCALEKGCGRLHADVCWHWQFLYGGIWYNMPRVQRNTVEKAYLDVWEDSAEMPAIDAPKMGNLGIAMLKILGTAKWLAEFDDMTMTNLSHVGTTLKIRRLSTPSTVKSRDKNATIFVWFFKNKDDVWVEFGSVEDASEDSSFVSPLTSCYDIEKTYNSGKWDMVDVTVSDGCFELIFSSMSLRNKNTREEMQVRRRPQQTRSDQIDLRTKRNVTLSISSKEYKEVYASLLLSLKLPEIVSIERIQNPQLWKAFKKRCEELSAYYGDGILNIHTLFHWVPVVFLDDVCKGNFKRKHQCPEVKSCCRKNQVCFYKSAEFLHESCSFPSERYHRLLAFKVLVGRIKESQEESAGKEFNTEVDNGFMPNRYIKYDKKDYCPAYIIKL